MSDIVKGLRLLVPSDSSGAAIKAIDEITRLRNELYIAQEWSARVIAGQEEDVRQITALRAEVEDLGNRLHHVHRLWANNEHALRAENERLRAALEPLACTCDRANGDACSRAEADCAFWIARAALEEKL